jgi:hypothetical protein
MSKNLKIETESGSAAVAPEPNVNPYLTDALERMERLSAILDGFPKAADLPRLTPAEVGAARRVTVEALQQAARFAEERPNIAGDLADVAKLNDATHFLMAYEGLREKAYFFLRDLDQILIQCKSDAAKYARGLYRMAKAYAASSPKATQVQTQVEVMKPAFGRRRIARPAKPADPDAPAVKK